jgi:Icc-related predicted phosphoesterase
MRVYAVADIHGKKDRVERIKRNLAELKADMLILAGDITNYTKPGEILGRLNALPVPVLLIRGNSDAKRVERLFQAFPNCVPLHAVCTTIETVPFVGIGGTLPIPFRSRIRLKEASCLKKIEPLITARTVLVTHTPPYGCRDLVLGRFHAGSKGLLRLIRKRRPQINICGHIHEDGGVAAVGKTRVANCALGKTGSGALLVFENGNLARLEMI